MKAAFVFIDRVKCGGLPPRDCIHVLKACGWNRWEGW